MTTANANDDRININRIVWRLASRSPSHNREVTHGFYSRRCYCHVPAFGKLFSSHTFI